MIICLFLPFFLQILIIGLDEFCFHVKRGLPRWERIGHPLDTLTVLICFSYLLFTPYSPLGVKIYMGLSLLSCLFVTKDEFIHKECCPAREQWLHALLFLNHPIVLAAAGFLWPIWHGIAPFAWMEELLGYQKEIRFFLSVQVSTTALFCLYQAVYWNVLWKEK